MKISVYGSGYVGLVAAACFAQVGHNVVCMDTNVEKVSQLRKGILPIFEAGLAEVVHEGLENHHLEFTHDIQYTVEHGECQFIAVGTPSCSNGQADTTHVVNVATSIGQYLKHYALIINKSTVPVGTADLVFNTIEKNLAFRNQSIDFAVASNPEFLKEGVALADFINPDRIIIGTDCKIARNLFKKIYAPFNHNENKIIFMNTRSAELTKYAANALLATKISFMNEIANLAETVGADIKEVKKGIGSDPRIGIEFLEAGCGYGGSCFGKDVKELVHLAHQNNREVKISQAALSINEEQKMVLFHKVKKHFKHNLVNKTFAIWGVAFKPGTDDVRDAPSLKIIEALLKCGAILNIFDPKALDNMPLEFRSHPNIFLADNEIEALQDADGLIILTEWPIFKNPDFQELKSRMSSLLIFDGRNIFEPSVMAKKGIQYYGIGRKSYALNLNRALMKEEEFSA